jgi:hypothetical protein
MNEGPRSNGWWQTVPGILTAATGIITAIAGLIVVLNQAGFFARNDQKAPPVPNDIAAAPKATESPRTTTTARRPPTAVIPQVAGTWRIFQTGDETYVGELHLSQDGTTLTGELVWESLSPATVASGEVSERGLGFVARYKDGVEGRYTGTFNEAFDRVDGTTRGQGRTLPWHAARVY